MFTSRVQNSCLDEYNLLFWRVNQRTVSDSRSMNGIMITGYSLRGHYAKLADFLR